MKERLFAAALIGLSLAATSMSSYAQDPKSRFAVKGIMVGVPCKQQIGALRELMAEGFGPGRNKGEPAFCSDDSISKGFDGWGVFERDGEKFNRKGSIEIYYTSQGVIRSVTYGDIWFSTNRFEPPSFDDITKKLRDRYGLHSFSKLMLRQEKRGGTFFGISSPEIEVRVQELITVWTAKPISKASLEQLRATESTLRIIELARELDGHYLVSVAKRTIKEDGQDYSVGVELESGQGNGFIDTPVRRPEPKF